MKCKDKTVQTNRARDIGLILVLLATVEALITRESVFSLVAIVLLFVCMIKPDTFRYLVRPWFMVAEGLGAISNRVLLTMIFFIVVVPMAFFRQFCRKMDVTPEPCGDTAFIIKDKVCQSGELEHPY